MTTKRINWIFVLRLSMSASSPRPDEHGWQGRGPVRVGRQLPVLRVLGRQDPVAQHGRHLRAEDTTELIGEIQVEDGVEVGVVTDDELPADAEGKREGARDAQRLREGRPGVGEPGDDRVEALQRRHQLLLGAGDDPRRHPTEIRQARQQGDELLPLPAQPPQRGRKVSSACRMSCFCSSSVPASRLMLSSAVVICAFWRSSVPRKVCRDPPRLMRFRSARCRSGVPTALLSSLAITWIWVSPPWLSSSDSAPSTCSASAADLVSSKEICAPSWSRWGDASAAAGAMSATYFSPNREVCWISACEFAGSFTSPFTLIFTLAHHCLVAVPETLQSVSEMAVTLPSATSLTLTADCGTRSRTSAK